jgi:opacity protein-like surface antigen
MELKYCNSQAYTNKSKTPFVTNAKKTQKAGLQRFCIQYTEPMRHLYIIFLIVSLPVFSFGQNQYFSTDSLTTVGIKLIDGGDLINSRKCQVKAGDKINEYSPYEVREFGFKGGRVYKSREIQIAGTSKRVFLEQLHTGKATLYYYRGKGIKTFFIEKDSMLFVEVPKQNTAKEQYSQQLLNITADCPNVMAACELVRYNKKSLSKLMTRYNQCELKPFPHFSYGFLMGYEISKSIPTDDQNEDLKYFDYKYDGGFSVGLFLDNPILVSDFSLHTELYFSKHGYSYNHASASEDLDLIINISSLRVPFMIRYTVPKNNLRPYFNAGAMFAYNINNESALYKAFISDNVIYISKQLEESIISTNEIGFVLGGGLEYDLDYKKSVFLEIRYSKLSGLSELTKNRNSIINISSGFKF